VIYEYKEVRKGVWEVGHQEGRTWIAAVTNLDRDHAIQWADQHNSPTLANRIKDLEDYAKSEKEEPLLMREIVSAAKKSIGEAIAQSVGGYNSPMSKLAARAIAKHEKELFTVFDEVIFELNSDADFRAEVKAALRTKLSRLIVSSQEGEIEKVFHALKQDPVRRAQITQAVANALAELGAKAVQP